MTYPEGRQPLSWSDLEFADKPKGHPSTWQRECAQLRELNTELALQALASDGQAAEAHEARLIAEDQAKALRARVAELEDALHQCLLHIHRDEVAHGRNYGAGNAARAALQQEGG